MSINGTSSIDGIGSTEAAKRAAHSRPAESTAPNNGAVTDYIVPPAMLAVAIACGLASCLHLGFTAEFSAAIGLALFCILLLCHVLLRPADHLEPASERPAIPEVASPLARPQRAERSSLQPDLRERRPEPAPLQAATRPEPALPARAQGLPAPTTQPASVSESGRADVRWPQTPDQAPFAAEAPPATPVQELKAAREAPASPTPPSLPGAQLEAQPDSRSQHWTYRPLNLQLPVHVGRDAASEQVSRAIGDLRPTIVEEPTSAPTFGTAPLSEPERVEQILKRLAAQIRAGGDAAATASPAPSQQPTIDQSGLDQSGLDQSGVEPPAAAEAEASLESAVNTLRSTVEAMRADLHGTRPRAARPSLSGPPLSGPSLSGPSLATPADSAAADGRPAVRAPTAAEIRLAAVAEALAAERANVFLQPILSLRDDRAQNFEVSVRLRTRDGQVLERQQVADNIRGAGLLPLLDAIGVRHSAGFALKLERRGRDGAVFSQVAGESLEHAGFVSDVAVRQAQGIADRLVLSFDQEEIRGLGAAQMAALASLNDLGFRFAIERLSHLDMDFEALADTGFAFVKLDAEVFARGLAIGGAVVSPSDLGGFFRDLGLAVIVGRIDDEAMRGRMLDYGVVFGQGALFGEPRPVPVGSLDAGDSVAA